MRNERDNCTVDSKDFKMIEYSIKQFMPINSKIYVKPINF